jgi:selenocysteine lyase/cysteine desulfurase
LARRDGGRLEIVPRPADFDWTAAVLARIGDDTGIAALPNCHWTDGSMLDLEAIGAACRARGIPLVVDATQTAGALPTDVKRIRPDYLVASGYKWLLCPDSMGFTYVAPERQDGAPIERNYAAYAGNPPMEMAVGYGTEYADGARRFDMGAADSMIHVPMSVPALEKLNDWGQEEISGYLRPIVERIAAEATARGMTVPPQGRRAPHFIGLRRSEPFPPGLIATLAARGAHVALRGGAIRVSPYLYNTEADVERFFAILDEALAA